MAQKEGAIFQQSGYTKMTIKKELVGVFNSVFSYGKLRDSSLTYFLGFVVLGLKIVEHIGQLHKSTFPFETSLMTSSM